MAQPLKSTRLNDRRARRRPAAEGFTVWGPPLATPEAWPENEAPRRPSDIDPRSWNAADSGAASSAFPDPQQERDDGLADLGRGVVHQFRNHLCLVAGGLHAGLLQTTDPSAVELLRLAENGARRMAQVLDDLFDLTQTPAGGLEPLVPALFFGRFLDRVEPSLTARGIALERDWVGGPPAFWGHAERLTEALQALIDNAAESMPGGGRLRVSVGGDRRTALTVCVADDGVGMTDNVRRRALQPFFTTKEGARGLGLTRVRRTMEIHRGALRLDSAPGRGTSATLFFPASD